MKETVLNNITRNCSDSNTSLILTILRGTWNNITKNSSERNISQIKFPRWMCIALCRNSVFALRFYLFNLDCLCLELDFYVQNYDKMFSCVSKANSNENGDTFYRCVLKLTRRIFRLYLAVVCTEHCFNNIQICTKSFYCLWDTTRKTFLVVLKLDVYFWLFQNTMYEIL